MSQGAVRARAGQRKAEKRAAELDALYLSHGWPDETFAWRHLVRCDGCGLPVVCGEEWRIEPESPLFDRPECDRQLEIFALRAVGAAERLKPDRILPCPGCGGLTGTLPGHGTRASYVRGCRCDNCRAANARYARSVRARTVPSSGS